ncbi:hypothetical protein HG531_001348 [Fusarium graminearum]|nr:hypothetical protein HG531_001348 [Fusarium graminearum]
MPSKVKVVLLRVVLIRPRPDDCKVIWIPVVTDSSLARMRQDPQVLGHVQGQPCCGQTVKELVSFDKINLVLWCSFIVLSCDEELKVDEGWESHDCLPGLGIRDIRIGVVGQVRNGQFPQCETRAVKVNILVTVVALLIPFVRIFVLVTSIHTSLFIEFLVYLQLLLKRPQARSTVKNGVENFVAKKISFGETQVMKFFLIATMFLESNVQSRDAGEVSQVGQSVHESQGKGVGLVTGILPIEINTGIDGDFSNKVPKVGGLGNADEALN